MKTKWLPIETAPDRKIILVAHFDNKKLIRSFTGIYHEHYNEKTFYCCSSGDKIKSYLSLTHWRPIPEFEEE